MDYPGKSNKKPEQVHQLWTTHSMSIGLMALLSTDLMYNHHDRTEVWDFRM